jgi:hypothetical protein
VGVEIPVQERREVAGRRAAEQPALREDRARREDPEADMLAAPAREGARDVLVDLPDEIAFLVPLLPDVA